MSDQIKAAVTARLDALLDPFTGKKITTNRSLKSVMVSVDQVTVHMQKGYPLGGVADQLSALIKEALQDLPFDNRDLVVELEQKIISHSVQQGVQAVDGVKNIIAVASGKGGVGKSTVTANLALALSAAGANVAVLDADIYGPSQPRMLGASGKPDALPDKRLIPLQSHDLKIMSIGFMVDEDTPMIWRGPMVTQALEQMLRGTNWKYADGDPDIDYMIVDLPPGTGDIQLTLSQKVPVSGALIVTTPQDIALLDARRAFKMFKKVEVPILGVIENMSTHICSKCGHEDAIFGADGAQKMADEYQLTMLGKIPLERAIRELADSGTPTVIAEPQSAAAQRYTEIALKMVGTLSVRKKDFSAKFPNIVVEHS